MIRAAICTSFKLDCLPTAAGVHLSGDTYKCALFVSAAQLSQATTQYRPDDEVVAEGYTAGGAVLSGLITALDGDAAYLSWTINPLWPNVTITARGALIYNASKGNKAVVVLDFGMNVASTLGPFTVELPARLVRIA